MYKGTLGFYVWRALNRFHINIKLIFLTG